MFKKILVANRGEIACRVFKTAKAMGIRTVAVYSDADAKALHVQLADEAVHIGASASSESYLDIEKIVAACVQSGADAVHPGYGFLSENKRFRRALDAAGIAFIGPGEKAIESMGDKITSKKIADQAGVSTVPGYTEVINDVDHALEISAKIGYPVMLKASAGGGGKGMRVAHDATQCREGFERARNEARSSFGDDRIFIEKFITQPRHIEIQVIVDQQGHGVYLGERECSIQRRHQKVIEEAPSAFIDDATRKSMGEQALALAAAVDYFSAGTVEFIVDSQRNFYFLEMNTRLQVEHPVTELITGYDLVELMIRVAAGEKLPMTQAEVKLRGWAMEARVYAESPLRGFLPSTGRLQRYQAPLESAQIRVDTGVYEGGEVSMYYDPMIAKLISYGDDRDQARAYMLDALDRFVIRGVEHNIAFLSALFRDNDFAAANISTDFIAEKFGDGFSAEHLVPQDPRVMLLAAAIANQCDQDRTVRSIDPRGSEQYRAPSKWALIAQQQHEVEVSHADGRYLISLDGECFEVICQWQRGQLLLEAQIDAKLVAVQVERQGAYWLLTHHGTELRVLLLPVEHASYQQYMIAKTETDMSQFLLSPMPGLLVSIAVKEGEAVQAGQELAVIEAMKMENTLHAQRAATVKSIQAKTGDSLGVDQVIIEFE